MEQAVIIGAGPCGLSAALELHKLGIEPLIIEKHFLAHSIYLYPTRMQFFSTADRLSIGGMPFASPHEKPYRDEALSYYRAVAAQAKLRIRPYEEVTAIRPIAAGGSGFELATADRAGEERRTRAHHVIVATGYFDHPNLLGIPGEELPNVTHYYREAHPYTGMKVAIIGGNNSAVDAAMDLIRVGAKVKVIYRGDAASQSVKPWVKPLFEAAIQRGDIEMRFRSRVVRITRRSIAVEETSEDGLAVRTEELENDFVLALTGFRPNRKLLETAGVKVDDDTDKPQLDPDTMETNVPGLYVAGVIASGRNANEVFIESGRFHGTLIAAHMAGRLMAVGRP